MSAIKLWVNAREVMARPDQTVMEAADQAGIIIPRLCYHPFLKPSGSCRLCAVEIEGQRGLPAACSTPVEEGMRVVTESPKVQDFRREMLRLILEDHPRECVGCPRNKTCELQQLVAHIGIDFAYGRPQLNRPAPMEGGNYFERDYSLCVRCGRCVRVCHEIRGARAIVFREKAGRQEVSTPFERNLPESGCQFCGSCVDVCPVGALREKPDGLRESARQEMISACGTLSNLVMDLFAAELPRTWKSSVCPVCSAGCSMMFELSQDGRILQSRPNPQGPANSGQACVQGRFLLRRRVQDTQRPVTPLVLENGAFKQTSWDAALDLAASRLKDLSQGQLAVLTDGRATNEELFLLQKFSKSALKTGLLGCTTPPGHQEASETLHRHLGLAGATGNLHDLSNAGCILALGIHTAGDHPIAGTRIRQAVLNGAKLVSASPVQNAVARYADIHLDIYPGTESALVAGLLRLCLMDPTNIDSKFSEQFGADLEILKTHLEPYSLEEVSRITGASQEKLIEASCLLTGSRPLHLVYGRAVLNHNPAASVIEGLLTLSQAMGSLLQPGGGISPLYGTGNLQGAWDMGMAPRLLPDEIERGGIASSEIGEVLETGTIKGLFLVAESHTHNAWKEFEPHLSKLEFVLIHDIALPKVDLPEGTIFLPMASVLEKEGTITSGERRIQKVQPIISPKGESRCSRWVVSELARRLGCAGFEFKSADSIFQVIRDEIPAYAGTDSSGLITAGSRPDNGGKVGITWIPNPTGFDVEEKDKEHSFALISREKLIPYFMGPLSAEEALITSANGDAIGMNPADAFGMGFLPGDVVRVVTRHGEFEGPLAMWELLPQQTVSIPLHMLNGLAEHPGMNQTIFAARVEKR